MRITIFPVFMLMFGLWLSLYADGDTMRLWLGGFSIGAAVVMAGVDLTD